MNKNNILDKGFTIVELLVVIVIIGVLAAITIVSYIGISSKAIVATMQSDLLNSAKKINIYQVENGAYPATQQAAIDAKLLIANSQMDYSYYGVDDVSNPKSFCYMNRKGTETYAVSSDASPSKGACLKNEIINGNINDTTKWYPNRTSVSASANVLNLTISSISGYNGVYNDESTSIAGHKYYYRLTTTPKYANSFLIGYDSDKQSINTGIVANTANVISAIGTASIGGDSVVYYHNTLTNYSVGDVFTMQKMMTIDLTAAFGSGNEPDKSRMDAIVNGISGGWFNGTVKVAL